MASPDLPHPDEFEDLTVSELKIFPKHLPNRPRKSKPYLGTLIRNNKLRILVCTIAFIAMIGGTAAAALFISRGMERIKEGQAALTTMPSLPLTTAALTPLQSTRTKTMMVTQTSVVTGQITQSTVYVTNTAPPIPAVSCQGADTGITCGGAASGPEPDS